MLRSPRVPARIRNGFATGYRRYMRAQRGPDLAYSRHPRPAALFYASVSFIGLKRFRISSRAVGVGAEEGVTIGVAVKPAARVIVGGTLWILIRTGIRWASRTHV